MSDAAPDSLSFSAEIDAICDRFEAAWKAGQQPRIEDYLCLLPEAARETQTAGTRDNGT